MTDTFENTPHNEEGKDAELLKTPRTKESANLVGDALTGKISASSTEPAADDDDEEVDPNADLVGNSDLEDDVDPADDIAADDLDFDNEESFKLPGYQYRAPIKAATSDVRQAERKASLLKAAKQKEEEQKKAKQKEEENKRLLAAKKKEEQEKARIAKKKTEEENLAAGSDASSGTSSSVSLASTSN